MNATTFPSPQNDLVALIAKIARCDGGSDTTIPALTLYRRNKVSEPIPCIYGLGIAVAAQGRKRLMVSDDVIEYGPGQSLLTTIDLPGVSHISYPWRAAPSATHETGLVSFQSSQYGETVSGVVSAV